MDHPRPNARPEGRFTGSPIGPVFRPPGASAGGYMLRRYLPPTS